MTKPKQCQGPRQKTVRSCRTKGLGAVDPTFHQATPIPLARRERSSRGRVGHTPLCLSFSRMLPKWKSRLGRRCCVTTVGEIVALPRKEEWASMARPQDSLPNCLFRNSGPGSSSSVLHQAEELRCGCVCESTRPGDHLIVLPTHRPALDRKPPVSYCLPVLMWSR